jgi:hypothetical protein
VRNTTHFRHDSIFSRQLSCTWPRHIVPLINQQRCPPWNSHAGQVFLVFMGHFFITQQGFCFLSRSRFIAKRKSTCRSICTGIFLHPCSKLCMAFREVPSSSDIWLCVFPSWRRIKENSPLSTNIYLHSFVLRPQCGECKEIVGKELDNNKECLIYDCRKYHIVVIYVGLHNYRQLEKSPLMEEGP